MSIERKSSPRIHHIIKHRPAFSQVPNQLIVAAIMRHQETWKIKKETPLLICHANRQKCMMSNEYCLIIALNFYYYYFTYFYLIETSIPRYVTYSNITEHWLYWTIELISHSTTKSQKGTFLEKAPAKTLAGLLEKLWRKSKYWYKKI